MSSALIIGQGTLPVMCATIFARHGMVSGVCSPDDPLRSWARDANVPHFEKLSGLRALAESQPFDYLFSIANYKVLKADLLRLPASMAINYHDGPLPRYGGVYATTWAIMNGETTHGISWHVMTEQVDGGDLLKQAMFPIGQQDTAYKLNLKCYYNAIAAFAELVPELIAGSFQRTPQDLTQRTYFGLSKRPDNDCLINFDSSAQTIDAFCRSLDFEGTPNPMGVPKAVIGGRLYLVKRIELTGIASAQKPGTVVSLDPVVRVATRTDDIVLPVIASIRGDGVALWELKDQGLLPGVSIHAESLSAVTPEPS